MQKDTYFDMLLAWFTDRVSAMEISFRDQRQRTAGQSGYNFWRLLSHARRLIMSARINYLRVGAAIGIVAALVDREVRQGERSAFKIRRHQPAGATGSLPASANLTQR